MALAGGTRIGPYEILTPLGAGGMGQVYRARDTQLGRDVAIKALPDLLASDPERVARFQREAQVLATLNHPNIGGIYGLQEHGGSKFLVLEFVDGSTLADHIAKARASGLPLAEALPIARQIIDALEAAHDKNIIHRDLKPANIMITGDGQAKVLDFGLARIGDADPANSTTNSPTFTMAATQAGMILGTAAYMSPEQAKGRLADKRSDVWAFGCVLYEMLTGRRVFEGEDVSETLASVLRADPQWTALPATTPPGVRTVIERCLQRDRKTRIPDMAVVRYLLDDAMAPMAPAAATPARSAARPIWIGLAFVSGVILAAVAVWAAMRGSSQPVTASTVRFSISPPTSQRLAPTIADRQVALSPDGKYMVYVSGTSSAGGQVMLRSFDRLETTPVVGAVSARFPFFSPDGKWIGYFTPTEIRKIATAGGPSIMVCPLDGPPRGATWVSESTIIFATAQPNTGLLSVSSAGGGVPKNLTTPVVTQGEGDHVFPVAVPDGRSVLYTIFPTSLQAAGANVALLDLESGASTVLIRGGTYAEYVEPGYLIYSAAGALRGVRFDLARRQVQGDPVSLGEDVAIAVSGASQMAVSRTGMLLYVPTAMLAASAGGGSDRTLVWMDRQGREQPIKGIPPRAYFALRLSPDGTRVALDIRDQENDIWVWDLVRATLTRSTFDPGADIFPVWSRDSRRILFSSSRTGAYNIYMQAADGTGTTERVTEASYGQYATTISADGATLVITDLKLAQNSDLSLLTLGSKEPPAPLLASPATERGADISPDGRFIVYETNESSTNQIFVRPFPKVNDGKWQVSTTGGTKPVWSPTGRELFYIDSTSRLVAVPVQLTPSFKAGTPATLFETHNIATLASGRFLDPSKDGQKFVMIKELPPPPGAPVAPPGPTFVVVLNWIEDLKARVAK